MNFWDYYILWSGYNVTNDRKLHQTKMGQIEKWFETPEGLQRIRALLGVSDQATINEMRAMLDLPPPSVHRPALTPRVGYVASSGMEDID